MLKDFYFEKLFIYLMASLYFGYCVNSILNFKGFTQICGVFFISFSERQKKVYNVHILSNCDDDSNMLQQELDRLSVWESLWDIEFNPSKCQVVHVNNF